MSQVHSTIGRKRFVLNKCNRSQNVFARCEYQITVDLNTQGLDESTGSWSVGRLIPVVFSADGQFPDA